ncbi:phosphonate C-P lyase system protein PhnG [Ciceribacter sp. L1K22]|uniref:phosphonate C-P lyase system protein PhnG n=1 Tax=Ciceribacter sp. L1K22 TaxID=2820275 RepID=UPI001ABEE074|nr:phosphonate C-P lyase system protein PhnG [Ciceribacter sp. L1K22]MBO3758562.1 phosphonate C-P lyase system protein PhnG [Ciceribacter sp. L1K22]
MELPAEGMTEPPRKRIVALLAKATSRELQLAWEGLEPKPEVSMLRGPETGLVMVKGRIGGGGAAFNLGEATVSRATIRLTCGTVGHGQTLGTGKSKARLAAIFDALWQKPETNPLVEALLATVAARLEAEDRKKQEETAATRVDFFTMVRGEDK